MLFDSQNPAHLSRDSHLTLAGNGHNNLLFMHNSLLEREIALSAVRHITIRLTSCQLHRVTPRASKR